ncbi:hypothetical protein WA026_019780 [Henosepilachna vigintioctopunctata]|uniref:Uncharacterized protein n=1 Tax=Henosepilachna vigintioctopunctata TaxID=420089 RepID=A0AAW1VG58_9CUCU
MNCRSKNRKCRNCGEERTSENDYTEENCKNETICIHWCDKGDRATADRKCPEYKIQKELMALDNLSYFQASKTIEGDNLSRTYNPLEFPPLPATSRAVDHRIILDVCLIGSYESTDHQPSSILTKSSKYMEQKTNE